MGFSECYFITSITSCGFVHLKDAGSEEASSKGGRGGGSQNYAYFPGNPKNKA